MAKINQLTAKGRSIRDHINKCDRMVSLVVDPDTRAVLDELIDALDELLMSAAPCWEAVDTEDIGDDPDEEPLL